MLAVARIIGRSVVGYDAGEKGEHYNHNNMLADAAASSDKLCIIATDEFEAWAIAWVEGAYDEFNCAGAQRADGSLFCHACLDHIE